MEMWESDSEFVYDGDGEVGKVSLLVLRRRPYGRVTFNRMACLVACDTRK